jgi:Zn-dependent peptidase ImmA (M78 family)
VPQVDPAVQDPEATAELVRVEWGLGHAPAPNMVHLLELQGVRVCSQAEECREVDAFSYWYDGTPCVCLNTTKAAERGRFDAAHELGHLILHRGHAHPDGRFINFDDDTHGGWKDAVRR